MTRRSTDADASGAEAPTERSARGITRRVFLGTASAGLVLLVGGGGALGYALRRVNRIGSFPAEDLAALRGDAAPILFRRHPALASTVPWRPIGAFPTPVEPLPLPSGADGGRLFVKRDDLASGIYGGNKVRKLEHFLAEAELGGHDTLVTLGGLGTNHGLATALHGRALGFATEVVLYDQPVTPQVERNLAELRRSGARLHRAGSEVEAFLESRRALKAAADRGASPYFINVGGSSRLGTLGFVGAAFELAEQISARELPVPDAIFVPLGTCGTAAGLLAGLRLAGVPSKVCAVRVTGLVPANRFVVRHFANDVEEWLRGLTPGMEPSPHPVDDLEVMGDHRGPGYGVPTPEAEAAVEWASPRLSLETTYSGKALAACLEYCGSRMRPGETVLFWNTFDSVLAGRAGAARSG